MAAFTEEWLRDYQDRHGRGVTQPAPVTPAKAAPALSAPEHQNTISLALSAPPSVNAMYVNVPGKGRARSTAYRKWRRNALTEALSSMVGKNRIVGPYRMTVRISARGDLDGRIKATGDICKTVGAIVDDRFLFELHVYPQAGASGVWILLEPMPPTVYLP